MATLQTLDRGLRALFLIGRAEAGITAGELAQALGVDRAIAYRIIATLEANSLVMRLGSGRLVLGAGVLQLESGFLPQFRAAALPHLQALAEASRATAFVSVADGSDCVAVVVAEPESGLIRVGYKVGSRHPLTRGAAGIAILSGRPEAPDDTDDIRTARADGFCVTRGALQQGAVGVACPLVRFERAGRPVEASVGVVAMDDLDVTRAAPLIRTAAADIGRGLTVRGAQPAL